MSDVVGLERLPYWLRPVQLEAGGVRQQAIAQAASGIGGDLYGRDVLDMTLLAHGHPIAAPYERLAAAIAEEDETFGSAADDLESHIAAGAVIAVMLAGSNNAGLAAHGVLSAAWAGLSPAIVEMPELAEKALFQESERCAPARRCRLRVKWTRMAPRPRVRKIPFGEVPDYEADGQPAYSQDLRVLVEAVQEATRRTAIRSLSDDVVRRMDAADRGIEPLVVGVFGLRPESGTSMARTVFLERSGHCGRGRDGGPASVLNRVAFNGGATDEVAR